MSDKLKDAAVYVATDLALDAALTKVFELILNECVHDGTWDLHDFEWEDLYD